MLAEACTLERQIGSWCIYPALVNVTQEHYLCVCYFTALCMSEADTLMNKPHISVYHSHHLYLAHGAQLNSFMSPFIRVDSIPTFTI